MLTQLSQALTEQDISQRILIEKKKKNKEEIARAEDVAQQVNALAI